MIKQRIPSVDPATATGSNKKYFDILQSALGVVPNMTRAMAQSPAVLEAYVSFSGAMRKGTLSKKLSEEFSLAIAAGNKCDYCASAHSVLAKGAGLNDAQIASALKGIVEDAKEAVAIKFANSVLEKRGRISSEDFDSVINAGYTSGEVGEIVAHVALNIFTNYFNIVAETEIEFPVVNVA